MNSAQRDFIDWTECLLDPASTPGEQRQAAQEWCAWGLGELGVDPTGGGAVPADFASNTNLPTGQAISPLGAARCVWEYRRTAVLLRAMDEAIRAALEKFPGETIHVVEAGCGPLAPLALAFALRHAPERVQFTLLDLHPHALAGARRIAERLGAAPSIRAYVAADATRHKFAATERPHVIVCEVLLRALTREPQVAATRQLAPQVRPGGFFLPECIAVRAALFNHGEYTRPRPEPFDLAAVRAAACVELGPVFQLEAANVDRLQPLGAGRLAAARVSVPPHDAARWPLRLLTRIRVFRGHTLGDFDSSLNLPKAVKYPAAWAERGGTADFFYELSSDPGLRFAGGDAGP
jgi:SAM-dependent methyltransferase